MSQLVPMMGKLFLLLLPGCLAGLVNVTQLQK